MITQPKALKIVWLRWGVGFRVTSIFFILWYCAFEFALSRNDVWLFGCTVSRLYLGRVSPRSELPDLLRWDSWSESELESEGGWHRIWSGLELRSKIFNYNTEEEMQETLTIRRWSDRRRRSTWGILLYFYWSWFYLGQDSAWDNHIS